MKTECDDKSDWCKRGGARPGCGRKPGVKTRPVRLPEWLLDELERLGDPRELILDACQNRYELPCKTQPETEND